MNKDHNEVWKSCLAIIRDNIPANSFRTWFIPITPMKLERNVLTIQVPSSFFYEYLEEHYIDILRKTLRKELGVDAKLEYSIVWTTIHHQIRNLTRLNYRRKSTRI